MPRIVRALVVALALLVAVPGGAFAAELNTDALLGATASPTVVTIGSNTVTINVWASGTIPANKSGDVSIVNRYTMAADGTISPSSDAADRTPLHFVAGTNYTQVCSNATPPQGCAANPFVVIATLVVADGTPDGRLGTLTVATIGATGLQADSTPDTGSVRVSAPVVDPCAGVLPPATPVIATLPAAPNGLAGWFVTVPSVSATSPDGATITYSTNGTTFSADAPALSDGVTTVVARATNGCNLSTDSSLTISIDTAPPVIVPGDVVDTTWRNTDLSQTFTASDATSQLVDAADASFTLTASDESTIVGGSVVPTSVSRDVYDVAGNKATVTLSALIDKSAPVLNVTGAAAGTVDICAGLPTRPTFDPTDALSGVVDSSDSWTTPVSASGVGTYRYTASATDAAGNVNTETRTYAVTYGSAFSGIRQPINADGSSRFKLGSTIPVKFALGCNGTPISNAVVRLTVKQGDPTPDAGVDEAISTSAATTGNLFRYDPVAGQYIFNLSTKSGYLNPGAAAATPFSQGTWTLWLGFDDGSNVPVRIQLVK